MPRYPFCSIIILGAALVPPLLGFHLILDSGYHDTQRIIQIIALLLVIAISIIKNDLSYLDISIVFLAILIYFIHTHPGNSNYHSLFEVSIFLSIFLASKKVAEEFIKSRYLFFSQTLKLIIAGSFLYAIAFLSSYIAALTNDLQFNAYNLIPGYDNYRFFNHTQTITTGILLFAIIKAKVFFRKRRWLLMAWFTLVFWWVLLLTSAGRGTLASQFIALLLLATNYRKTSSWINVFALSFITGFSIYLILFNYMPMFLELNISGDAKNIIERTQKNFLSSREILWECSIKNFLNAPLFGIGPMNFARICTGISGGAHPHNIVVQILSEWGIIFALIVFSTICKSFYMIYTKFNSKHKKNKDILILLCFIFIGLFLDGLVSGVFVMPTSQLYILFYLGIYSGYKIYNQENLKKTPRYIGSICLTGVFIALAISSFKTFEYSKQSEAQSLFPRNQLSPRAWSHGFI